VTDNLYERHLKPLFVRNGSSNGAANGAK
jgi:hypothetical protein